ncbi:hypothetical protein P389DRAFT_54792 [Cystobasidium minutum MCA 4210]|uniref:uncharacterized protein n=1 Tax=Cystobasidium minutum MCA 4210 TaxID=1397322 RepID=UPI0034CD797B|eukprot:jgi/Rhomi1/54792/CE54791_730
MVLLIRNVIHGMLNELKDEAAERLGRQRMKPSSTPKYALHRSIGTSYDVFSSVTDSIPRDDKALQQLTDTDLLAVYPTELADPSTAPRLGDINGIQPMTTKRAIELQPQIEPVSFLYYDPYQSFAPTYDSSTSTLSYSQSVSLRESRQSAQEWSNKPLPPLPPEDLTTSIRPSIEDTLSTIDPSLFTSNDVEKIDPSEMRVYLRMMEDSQVIDQRLKENTELLRALQEAQWHRLRRSEPAASEVELKSARRLLDSLTSLANARPRTPDISESSSPFTSNPFISASIVQSKPRAYYGVLDKANSKGIPDYVMAKDEHGLNGGSSLNPPDLARKNSTQAGKKSKKANKAANKSNDKGRKSTSPAVQMTELPSTAQVKQETPVVS